MNRLFVLALCLGSLTIPRAVAGPLRAGADVTDITPLPSHYPVSMAGSMSATTTTATDNVISKAARPRRPPSARSTRL